MKKKYHYLIMCHPDIKKNFDSILGNRKLRKYEFTFKDADFGNQWIITPEDEISNQKHQSTAILLEQLLKEARNK